MANQSEALGVTLGSFTEDGRIIRYLRECINRTLSNGSDYGRNCTPVVLDNVNNLKLVYHGEIWTPEVIQRIVMLTVIMTLTLVGNLTIIVVLSCSKYRKLNSRVNIFIINLAIGDLTVCCFTMTTEVLFVVFEGAWILGAAACKILLYIQVITLASTTFILTAMSFDRYLAICKPLKFGTSSSRARKMIAISWFLALIFASPQLLIFKQNPQGIYPDGSIKYKCQSKGYTAWWQRKLYFTFMTAYILVIPAILISFCYINVVRVVWRQGKELAPKGAGGTLRKTIGDKKAIPRAKIKTIKMTLSIIGSFIVCWTPYFVSHLIHIWTEYKYKIPGVVYVIAETMALLNSALNPILYGCFNIKLKRGLFEVFCPNRLRDKARRNCPSHMTEFMSLTEDNTCVGAAKKITAKCKDANSNSSGNSHYHKTDDARDIHRNRDGIITEQNRNGFRLRVRFLHGNSNNCKKDTVLLRKLEKHKPEEIETFVTTI